METFSFSRTISSFRQMGIQLRRTLDMNKGAALAKQIKRLLTEEHPGKNDLLVKLLNATLEPGEEAHKKFVQQINEESPETLQTLYALGFKAPKGRWV